MIEVIVVVVQIVLPAYLVYDVWRGRNETRWEWCLRAAAAVAYIAFVFLIGRWDLVGYPLRFVLPVVFVVGALAGYLRIRALPWRIDGRPGRTMTLVSSAVSLLLFAGLLAFAMRGLWYEGEAVALSAPLRGGAFYVGQGGNSALVNYHHGHATQRFAMDIVEIDGLGTRAASLHPEDLDGYVIFGRPVHSPCEGRVIDAVDGLPDNVPPMRDPDNATGNHVVVACHDVQVFLAHLRRGSVAVTPGDQVSAGEVIGRVGNSGNTSEPHLHVHAVRGESDSAVPVPILVDGTFAVRNTVLRAADD